MSKSLEALENILNQELIKPSKYRKTIRDIASVGQVIAIQKELKALDIIVSLLDIKIVDDYLIARRGETCIVYNLKLKQPQEIINLLKEVLKK